MPGFQRVAAASEFSDSLVRVFVVDGIDVAVVRHEGQFYAVERQLELFDYSDVASVALVVGLVTGRLYRMDLNFGDSTLIEKVSVQLEYSTPVSIEPPE